MRETLKVKLLDHWMKLPRTKGETMSFLSHIGLSVVDKLTGNALDKLGNAIKDGDVSKIVSQFTEILEGVEDKLGDVGDLFEDAIDDAKKDVRKEVYRVKRRLVRETRQEMEALHDQFVDKMAEAMEVKIKELVKLDEVECRGSKRSQSRSRTADNR